MNQKQWVKTVRKLRAGAWEQMITRRLTKLGMAPCDLARRMGTSNGMVHETIRLKYVPNLWTLCRLSAALDIPLAKLIGVLLEDVPAYKPPARKSHR